MSLDANAIFEEELAKRGLAFEREGQDLYQLKVRGADLTINLENARWNAERDGNPEAIRNFVSTILDAGRMSALPWEEAARRLLLKAEPSDYQFGDSIRSTVTDEVCRVLSVTNEEHSYIAWVTPDMCSEWGVTPEQAIEAALRNQDSLIGGLELEVDDVDGHPLGMVPLGSPYKASVIFAPSFRRLVEERFGWPVWVVVPCRDFIYVLREKSELVQRIGRVVVREYQSSGYPITTEVLRVSSDGIEAVGAFPKDSGV